MVALNPISNYKRLVIKIGSALLVDNKTGLLRSNWLNSLCQDIAKLQLQDYEIIIVSSGAMMLGRQILGLNAKNLTLEKLQACASVGQIALSQNWTNALSKYDLIGGQILITPNITEQRRFYLNAQTTINTLLELKAVPVINENDSVATAEIRYGDNDRLSARVASMIEADCLIILSDVDGLYSAPPQSHENAKYENAKHIAKVSEIGSEIEAMAGASSSHLARGGMITKIEAAKIATQSGTDMIITSGTKNHSLKALIDGAKHTLFSANQCPKSARKRWILGTLEIAGKIYIDDGAAKALKNGNSLLPIGVTKVEGEFSRGDIVAIFYSNEKEIARGLAGMDNIDANLAKGKNSEAIFELFETISRTELVHADNLVLITGNIVIK